MPEKPKVCLAYSGGLDTSTICAWLIDQGYDVICFMAKIGQEEDFDAAREKALKIGAKKCYIEDVVDEFVQEFCYPAIQCNAAYENIYLLGTALARPCIARAQIAIARKEGCQFVSHGCTGKGNDQIRFEFTFYALQPDIEVVIPWRIPAFYETFKGRGDLLDYAKKKGIPMGISKDSPWSMDDNLANIAYEAGALEDPEKDPPANMWRWTADPVHKAPIEPEEVIVDFENGVPTKISSTSLSASDPTGVFVAANKLACKHGVGRQDFVENRFVGIKGRGAYESPGLMLLRIAHMDLEGLVMDREVRALRDQFVTISWSRTVYNGFWFSPEREFLDASIQQSQKVVNGQVRLALYKGSCVPIARSSTTSNLYDKSESSMEEKGSFEPTDTDGFLKINSIRLKKYGSAKKEAGQDLVQRNGRSNGA